MFHGFGGSKGRVCKVFPSQGFPIERWDDHQTYLTAMPFLKINGNVYST